MDDESGEDGSSNSAQGNRSGTTREGHKKAKLLQRISGSADRKIPLLPSKHHNIYSIEGSRRGLFRFSLKPYSWF